MIHFGLFIERMSKKMKKSIDFIETQLDLIPKLGIQNYIQLQSDSAKEGS